MACSNKKREPDFMCILVHKCLKSIPAKVLPEIDQTSRNTHLKYNKGHRNMLTDGISKIQRERCSTEQKKPFSSTNSRYKQKREGGTSRFKKELKGHIINAMCAS